MRLFTDPAVALDERPIAEWREPTLRSTLVFQIKVGLLQLRRGALNLFADLPRHAVGDLSAFPVILAESSTLLWSDAHPGEQAMQFGKVQNLREAVRRLDRLALPEGGLFSFWRQIGRASRRRGFVAGRMLQQGCLMPAVGGGLCQLSNALYDVALQAGCEIVERHPHSRIVPGSAAALGRDATVAWNYVDLRFRAGQTLLIEARLTRDALLLRLRGQSAARHRATTAPTALPLDAARSCASCDETSCFRHEAPVPTARLGRKAFLLDENWPEIRHYLTAARQPEDVLGIPLDGNFWRLARYSWPTEGFSRVGSAPVATARRMLKARRLRAQGPERRLAEIESAAQIARGLGRLLTEEISQLVVAQALLPELWRSGKLGGRGFTVVMTRPPMAILQARLDAAAAQHPALPSLRDFRAPKALVEAETEALAAADGIVTAHPDIAALFPGRAELLDWALPPTRPLPLERPLPRRIAFAGPTVARKGAYALREALRGLDLPVVLLGSELEGADFWSGIETLRPGDGTIPRDWMAAVAAIVQPALVEERPRHLLSAYAAGLPIIASAACGLPAGPAVTIIPALDTGALRQALVQLRERIG